MYRTVMWNIAKGILWLLDGIFDIIDKIWRFRFFDNEYVNKVYSAAIIVACSWLVLKVVLELIMNFIVRGDDRTNPLSIYKGVILAIVLMFLISPLFNWGHDISTALTDSVITISGMNKDSNSEGTISKAIVRAMVYENETEEEDIEYLVKNWKKVDINDTSGGFLGIGDVYKYSLNFFMLIVLAVVTVFLLFFVAIQIAKRVMEIALYKILGPFCCTSLTNKGSKAFEVWSKSTMGVFLITVVQFVCIGLLLNLFGEAFTNNKDIFVGIFLIIGALLFIISTPTIVSSLLNQQSGMMTAFGDMQSLMALSTGITSGLSVAGKGASFALSKGANIIGGKAKGGINNISNMFSSKSNLTSDQMSLVKDSLNNHNSFKAQQQVRDFIKENKGIKSESITKAPNQLNQLNNMQLNPIKNQYINKNNNMNNGGWS